MSRSERYPVWHYVGWWKWPSVGLLAFCLLAIYPYVDRAPGGAETWGNQLLEGRLIDCPVRVGVKRSEKIVETLIWISPSCAYRLREPTVTISSTENEAVETRSLAGLPNPDQLRVHVSQATLLSITLSARNLAKTRDQLTWPLLEKAQIPATQSRPAPQ